MKFTLTRRPALTRFLTLVMALALAAIVAFSATARAASYTVANLNDSGAGSLRAAIAAADGNPGADTIIFQSGLSGTITLTSGTLQPAGSVNIYAGLSTDNPVTISGGNTQRIFSVLAGVSVTVDRLTFSGGSITGSGGAIFNAGTLTLTGCTLNGNTSSGGGGAIDCTSGSTLSLTNCTLSGNTAIFGGAINAASATVTLIHCTIANNTGTGGTGGIEVANGTTALTNTIIAGNTATGTTDADIGGAGTAFTLSGNNLIGKNSSSIGYNTGALLAGSPNASGHYVGTPASPVAANLAALANNGGPVQTLLPNTGSIVIDKVITGGVVVATDARGNARSLDGDASGTAQPDIGAVEFVPAAFLTVNSSSDSGTGSLRQAIANAAQLAGPKSVLFANANPITITLASTIAINDTGGVTMDASASGGVIISGAGAGGTFGLFTNATFSKATFNGLTLANGGGSGFSGNGGAINNSGTVTLTQCTLTGNSANSSGGGAISNVVGGTLTLTQCTLSGNSATYGGAISNTGVGSYPTLTLTQCTFSGNSATSGGAINNSGGGPTLTQCTFSGNSATFNSGGIFLTGSVLSDSLNLKNCIVAGNTAPSAADIGNFTNLTLTGANFIGDPSGAGPSFTNLTASATLLTTAQNGAINLAPLGSYGGPTQTMALLPNSPARDAAAVLVPAITSDQRAFPVVGTPDIGAYEARAPGDVSAFTSYNEFIWESLPTAGNGTRTDPQHATNFDYDGDDVNNYKEWLALTSPADSTSYLRVTQTSITGNTFNVTFPTVIGRNYSLEATTDLANPAAWLPVPGSAFTATTMTKTASISPITGLTTYFVRVLVGP